jgi:hypothetical protein
VSDALGLACFLIVYASQRAGRSDVEVLDTASAAK